MAVALALGAAGQAGQLPPYAESIRCAGLAEAASAESDKDSEAGRKLFDAALFWGLAASEAGRKDGIPAATFSSDQIAARTRAAGELGPSNPGAAAELEACLARVPPPKKP